MKTKTLFLGLGLSLIFGSAWAEGVSGAKPEREHKRLENLTPEQKARMEAKRKERLEKYDTNKNGLLDPEEKDKAKADRKKEMMKFDKNGDGQLDDAEKKAAHEARKKEWQEKKDAPK
jgi:hypothetical protein